MNDRTMLLIDADNVSADVIEQAVHQVLAEHGALHVRRAYCTAEAALKHQALFKRLGVRPMVNLAAGKNSTDIALAVDAMDLVVAERPRVVYLVSSDSDFAPLVIRLREKGCRVCGIGQQGKTGEDTVAAYDAFTDLRHRADGGAAPARRAGGTSATRAGPGTRTASDPESAPRASRAVPARAPAATSKRAAAGAADPAPSPSAQPPSTSPAPSPSATPVAPPARKTAARKTRSVKAATPPVDAAAAAAAEAAGFILDAAPSLRGGGEVALNDIAQALRTAGLLGKNASSVKLFEKLPTEFAVFHYPDRIRWIGAANAR
ncbi:MAG: NYN domain-containing protein [Variovorax sp.]|nr:MAG: NYN domain-containing protein [Variovorax sp.]